MTTYKLNEKVGKKLLVPVIALMLCALALIGAGYAALQSSVESDNNITKTDGIVLRFVSGDGVVFENGFISTDFIIGYTAETTYPEGTETIKYTYNEFENKTIGKAIVEIDSTKSIAEDVVLDYLLTTIYGTDDLPPGMSVAVKIDNATVTQGTGKDVEIDSSKYTECIIEILLTSENQEASVKEPLDEIEFKLKMTVEPKPAAP